MGSKRGPVDNNILQKAKAKRKKERKKEREKTIFN